MSGEAGGGYSYPDSEDELDLGEEERGEEGGVPCAR